MDERARRIGENEALFREVNEKIRSLNESFGTITGTFTLVCECGDETCMEQITMTRRDYEALRGDPALFAVKHGHEGAGVDHVIEERGEYDVVRKSEGPPARLAEATDPRT